MADRAKDSRDGVGHKYDPELDEEAMSDDEAPIHPVAAMQEAFEESIQEAADGDDESTRAMDASAEARRRELLDQPTYDASWTTRWKQRPSARCHPIIKLMSQIIFGLHLLYQRQAKSDAEVVKILQVHVDEIDAFLEKTTEDFDLAMKDIDERISFLKLPMTHLEVFDVMLDDKKFRTQLIEGNDKIESIIERTAKAMNAALLDVQKAVNTTQQLAEYLDSVQDDWPHETPDQSAIFVAMKGNEEGWRACLRDLQGKGHQLGVALVQLGTVVAEISKLAGAASRRNAGQNSNPQSPVMGMPPTRPHHGSGSPDGRGSLENSNKPLPKEPDAVGAAVRATIPKAHDTVMSEKKPKTKKSFTGSKPNKTNSILRQAKSTETGKRTAAHMQPREPTSPTTSQTKDLAGFIKSTKPPESSTRPETSTSTSRAAQPVAVQSNTTTQTRPQSPPQRANNDVQTRPQSPAQQQYQPPQIAPQNPAQQYYQAPSFRPQSPPQNQYQPVQPQFASNFAAPPSQQQPQTPMQQPQYNQPPRQAWPAPSEPMLPPPQPAAQSNMQYPMPSERPFHNALTAVAHRQTTESREPAPQEYTVTFEKPPRAELDATPFPRQVINMPVQQFHQTPTIQPPPTIKTRGQVQQPTVSQVQTAVRAPEKVQNVNNYDPRLLHRQMQERSKMTTAGSDVSAGPSTQHERQASEQAHGLSHNLSTSSGSKVDSAYALSSGKPPSEAPSQASSRAPSRLGLFPDTNVTTPPQFSRAASFSHQSPPQAHASHRLSPPTPMNYSHPKSTNKFSKFFKRKAKDEPSYVQVSPN
ncbi:hypothetical protein C1H76_3142 [Elsinoe australis]|uniref:Uncharacterized protein n=1 Tax=Elsinoe australis TaxID=40998 RepID=A0A4U7B8P7_9PEZI|nr:hypothetical protein C1H76_3142 [Elsinoe australis]